MLTKEKFAVPALPPKKSPAKDKKHRLNAIASGLEAMLNEVLANPDVAGNAKLCKFLETTPDIALHGIKAASRTNSNAQERSNSNAQEILHQTAPDQHPISPVIQIKDVIVPVPDAVITPADQGPQESYNNAANTQMLEQFTPPNVDADPAPLDSFQASDGDSVNLFAEKEDVKMIEIPAGFEDYMLAAPDSTASEEIDFAQMRVTHDSPIDRTPGPSLPPTPLEKSPVPVPKERIIAPGAFEGQYSGGDEEILAAWMGDLIEERPALPLQESLRSGVLLCKLVNRIRPQTIRRINNSQMPFPQRENINAFCAAVREMGVPDSENFNTDDLFDERNMKQVLVCLFSLGRQCYYVTGYEGPALGRPERANLGASNGSKFEVKADALWGKGNAQFKAADGRPSGTGTKGSLGHSPLRP